MEKAGNKINIILGLFIILLAVVLRLSCLEDPNGLWYDELVSYYEAAQPNILSLVAYTLRTDIHLPFYPLILHYWGKLISYSDYSLRLFSAVCGIITVIGAYLIGRELKSAKVGLVCAGVFACNSFLIYYSQEVRLQAFLMLLSTFYLLFLIRIKNNKGGKLSYLGLTIFSVIILNTYTIAFIFIFAQFLTFLVYLLWEHKPEARIILKKIIKVISCIFVLCSPLIVYFIFNRSYYTTQINGYHTDSSTFLVILQDWFTPVLVGLFNNPNNYIVTFISNFSFYEFVYILTPIVLSVYFIFYAIKQDKFSWVFFGASLLFLIGELIAYKSTNFKILSRYTSIAFPNILILLGYGLSQVAFCKSSRRFLLSIYFAINLSYLILMPQASFRMTRNGFRPLAEMLETIDIKQDDFVVVWNRREILDRYIKPRVNTLGLLGDVAYRTRIMLYNEPTLKKMPIKNRKMFLRDFFANPNLSINTNYMMKIICDHLNEGQKFIITTSKSFDAYSQDSFISLVKNDKKYSETSLNDLLTIKALINIKRQCQSRLHFVKRLQENQYVVWVFEK